MKNKSITIGISGYVGNKITGIGRVLEEVIVHLAKKYPDLKIILFINYDQDDYKNREWPANVSTVPYRVSKNSPILNILWHQYGFQRNLRKHKCDISLIPNFSLLIWKVCPTVVIIHDLIEFNLPSKFSKLRVKYRYIIVPRMARKSDFIITVSNCSKIDILKYCNVPEGKVESIYNAYDKSIFSYKKRNETEKVLSEYSLKYKNFILSVGTIDYPGKNVYSLVKAYINLKEQNKIKDDLVIVGKPGHNYNVVHDLIANSTYSSNIRLLGYLPDKDLPYLYNGAKAFAFLSFYEGFGLPLLEAMACGCPILSSNTSSLPEIAGDCCLYTDPNNGNEIEEKLMLLANSEDLQQEKIHKGLNRVKDFSWDISVEKYYNAFYRIKEKE
jgi:glycosyltransferase involved in cell wall biosynthesis